MIVARPILLAKPSSSSSFLLRFTSTAIKSGFHSYRVRRTSLVLRAPYQSQGKLSKVRSRLHPLDNTIRSSMTSTSASPFLSSPPEKQVERMLTGKEDDHGGVIVEMTSDPVEASLFVSLLRASISQWRQQGKKGIWIKLPIELVNLVEPVVKEGFYFHHAEPKYLMLVYWLPSTTNTLPANASHRVGIGAFIINEKNEILVVREKSGRFRGTGVWKLPTGVVDEGEDVCDAAVREVKEETGVETKFIEVLAFRQSHKSFFEKSDLFFVCMLEPLSFDIQAQETEIEAAQWMPIEEYAAQPFVQNHELMKYVAEICLAKKDGSYAGFTPVPTASSFLQKRAYLYFNTSDLNQH